MHECVPASRRAVNKYQRWLAAVANACIMYVSGTDGGGCYPEVQPFLPELPLCFLICDPKAHAALCKKCPQDGEQKKDVKKTSTGLWNDN